MDKIYKLKLTILQQEILRFLMLRAGESFNARNLSKYLEVSQTAISKALPLLEKKQYIIINREKESNRLIISLNRNRENMINLKRVENLSLLYTSGLVDYLKEKYPESTIVLFGSYSFGEDISTSDIDLAILGAKKKEIKLDYYEKILEKKVSLNYYDSIGKININLRENIINGILLKGGLEL